MASTTVDGGNLIGNILKSTSPTREAPRIRYEMGQQADD